MDDMITYKEIVRLTCAKYHITEESFKRTDAPEAIAAREEVAYLASHMLKLTTIKIAELFGQSKSQVNHARRRYHQRVIWGVGRPIPPHVMAVPTERESV